MAGGEGPCTSVFRAVARLGVPKLRARLHELVARQTVMSADKAIARACHGVWEHAVAVAIVARELAIMTSAGDGDDAYAAGLLHDLGKPIVATMLLDAERSSMARAGARWIDAAMWTSVVHRVQRDVAIAVVERWELAPAIQSAARQPHDYDSSERLSVGNAVRFANSLVKLHGFAAGPVVRAEEEAIILIGRSLLGVEDDLLPKLADGLRARVQQQLGW
jgi:HD-like signal output (HDOD) protein